MVRSDRRAIGLHYENLAKAYLQRQGLRFIAQNYQIRRGELDLIFRHRETLVFVEVKYRRNAQFGHAAEMVSATKQRRLWIAAQHWLRQNNYNSEHTSIRFDVIAIHQQGDQLEWFQNIITQG
ncbi:YraN family protein [Vibrio sp. SM6]|uniref:UPF0102 protein HGP28_05275 n=1 Tax=Vibrio agarilyticus TaxID=2726741 RepID=A0A7X8YGE6_9VIBR|nr:YraN family protein [Vibrio agarilyticus]NLS12307.1 YraN family protein [Vibrio agarilyticus]